MEFIFFLGWQCFVVFVSMDRWVAASSCDLPFRAFRSWLYVLKYASTSSAVNGTSHISFLMRSFRSSLEGDHIDLTAWCTWSSRWTWALDMLGISLKCSIIVDGWSIWGGGIWERFLSHLLHPPACYGFNYSFAIMRARIRGTTSWLGKNLLCACGNSTERGNDTWQLVFPHQFPLWKYIHKW